MDSSPKNQHEPQAQQLALALFQDMAPQDKEVKVAPAELGFRRNNLFVEVVDLSLAGRRLVDVAYFLVADDPEIQPIYKFELNFFKWLMNYSSNNRKHLKDLLREAQKAAIQVDELDADNPSQDRWGAVPLMGPAYIANGHITFELPSRLQALIKNPAQSHFLSLRFVFKSIHAKIIYDRIQPWLDERVSPWYEVDAMRTWLECNSKTYDEYKFLSNRVLKPAISHIREITGIELELDTKNIPGSKKVGQVRFVVKSIIPVESSKVALTHLKAQYEVLQNEFGLTREELNEVIVQRDKWSDDYINRAMEYTRHQITEGKVIQRAGGYLMAALRGGYIMGDQDRVIQEKKKEATQKKQNVVNNVKANAAAVEAAAAEKSAKEIETGLDIYRNLPPEEQKAMLDAFAKSEVAKLVFRRLNISSEHLADLIDTNDLVRTSLATYVFSLAKKVAR